MGIGVNIDAKLMKSDLINAGMTQRALAKTVKATEASISNGLKSERMSVKLLKKIADYFGRKPMEYVPSI